MPLSRNSVTAMEPAEALTDHPVERFVLFPPFRRFDLGEPELQDLIPHGSSPAHEGFALCHRSQQTQLGL